MILGIDLRRALLAPTNFYPVSWTYKEGLQQMQAQASVRVKMTQGGVLTSSCRSESL